MTLKLSTKHLQAIIEVAESGNITLAAQRLHLTQSALSHRIREAERLLNTDLYYRENKRLMPTNAAKRLIYSAKLALSEIERAEYDIGLLSVGIEKLVRLGMAANGCYHWLAAFLDDLKRVDSSLGVEVIADVSNDPFRALSMGDIDIAIVCSDVPKGAFHSTRLFRDELLAIMPISHALATKRNLAPEDFIEHTYIAHHTTPEKGLVYDQVFSRHRLLPKRVIRAGVTEAILALVEGGQGLSILPGWTLSANQNKPSIETRRITGSGIHVYWQAITRKSDPARSTPRQVVSQLKKCLSKTNPVTKGSATKPYG